MRYILVDTMFRHKTYVRNIVLSGDVKSDMNNLFDWVYSDIYEETDILDIVIENDAEYKELVEMIKYHEETMHYDPFWFSTKILLAMIKARYDYYYKGYEFSDYNFNEFNKDRGLD